LKVVSLFICCVYFTNSYKSTLKWQNCKHACYTLAIWLLPDCSEYGLRRAVPWFRSLVAGLSPRRPGFAPWSINVGFVVDKVDWYRFLSEFFGFPLSVSFHRRSPNSYHLGNA
jgi:hypothetical protein